MSVSTTSITVNSKLLLADGIGLVTAVSVGGFTVRTAAGKLVDHGWNSVSSIRPVRGANTVPVSVSLEPWWSSLPEPVREDALAKLEVVQLITTGYRDGHAALARPDEPMWPYGPMHNQSINRQANDLAEVLRAQNSANPVIAKKVAYGALAQVPGSADTIRRWVRNFAKDGISGLIDRRATRATPDFDRVHPTYREYALVELAKFNGDPSPVAIKEINRRTLVALKRDGFEGLCSPQRATQSFLSEIVKLNGKSARAQRSNRLRHVAGHVEYPAVRPGQIVAIDATRCDNLVVDEYDGSAVSVEILTAIDVASRVILACRVVPQSANSVDLAMLVYDVLREFHMVVDGTNASQWRWAGVPGAIDLTDAHARFPGPGRSAKVIKGRPLDGVHRIPSIWPDGVRVDRGSINISAATRLKLADFGIDLLPNRGGKSNDNSHIERWWETLEAGLQSIAGYKGRNTTQRGRFAAKEPLLTWHELQTRLRQWIALHYHQDWHTGIALPGMLDARLTPLDAFDALLSSAGRIDVPQRPDLIYQFLPVEWLTPNATGVERRNLVYSSPALEEFRRTYKGQFRDKDRAMPFYVDGNDVGQLWFRHPESHEVFAVPWRGRDRTLAPMTDKVIDTARREIRERGGNEALKATTAESNILSQLEELANLRGAPRIGRQLFAAELRTTTSFLDHAEAHGMPWPSNEPAPTTPVQDVVTDLDDPAPWPDYTTTQR